MRTALAVPLAGLVVAAGLLSGCVQHVRYPLNAFNQYDYQEAVKGYRATLVHAKKSDEKNVVLASLNLAGASFVGGNYRDSQEGLRAASLIMEDVEHGVDRGQAAMVLKHDMRVFKGEPYERALAYTYLGLLYYRRGDFENARSAFNLALLADRSSKDDQEEYREDFAIAHHWIGRTYARLGELDNATIALNQARKYMPDAPADPAAFAQASLSLVIELGCGPVKAPDPVVGSVDTIRPCVYPERHAEVWVGDRMMGKSVRLVDLNHQAKTSGTSGRDAVQAAKGVAVAVMKQLPFVGIVGSLMEMGGVNKADLRAWRHMPGEIHVADLTLPEGLHTVEIRFFGEDGAELERYRQVHHYVRVGPAPAPELRGEPVYAVRSRLDFHNELRTLADAHLLWGGAGPVFQQGRGLGSDVEEQAGLPLTTTATAAAEGDATEKAADPAAASGGAAATTGDRK
jgi:tetratricopeptide (TPR) repeat protein